MTLGKIIESTNKDISEQHGEEIYMIDFLYDLKYRILEQFEPETKCSKCAMHLYEKVSYEYDEYERHCLNGKDIYEIEHCFIPLIFSKIKARLFREKMLRSEMDSISESYADVADFFDNYDKHVGGGIDTERKDKND